MADSDPSTPARIDAIYREDSRRIYASLVRLLGDFDLAEDALHEAFAAAVEQWPRDGTPEQPRAWLISVGRFRAIDALRRRTRFDASLGEIANRLEREGIEDPELELLAEDPLRLIFICCHPALRPETQVALTLREVCGLSTEEVASAFLVSSATVAQRIVRGKAKIREENLPYDVPSPDELPRRLGPVLSTIYLVFSEGYSATRGASLTRPDLSTEAIRLCRVLQECLPDSEVLGLLALMLLHDSRRETRVDAEGDLILLEHQDRSRWDAGRIAEGRELLARAIASRRWGSYTIQAAIAEVHATAPSAEATDWARIVSLYDLLLRASPSPVVQLNRAVAVAMRDGIEAGLELTDPLLDVLSDYHLLHATRGDFLRRVGRTAEARAAYARALSLTDQDPERRFLSKRLRETS
ncbi:MAG: RNA polymerase sigma factor [Planctomycetes bacterium]|nr:RNA polymerase sigma factor [Planctomycetota bacterium]